MSDLNEDLLNYELGEELDDPTIADEDELLLSDEELEKDVTSEQKAMLKDEAEKWVTAKLKTRKLSNTNDTRKTEDIVTTSSSSCNETTTTTVEITIPERCNASRNESDDVSTSEELPPPQPKNLLSQSQETNSHPESSECEDQQSKNDEVTSTNKEIEDQSVSQTVEKSATVVSHDPKEELIQSSHESSTAHEIEESTSDPREDQEERTERTNIKQANERDECSESPEKNHLGNKFFYSRRGRGGTPIRGGHFFGPRPTVRYPHIQYPQYASHPNENSNPQIQYPYQPVDSQVGPRQPFPVHNQVPPRMDFRPPMGPNFRPQNPNEFMYRGPRPEYTSQPNGTPYYGPPTQVRPMFRPDGANAPVPPPQGGIRHRMPLPPRPSGIPPQGQSQGGYLGPTVVTSQPHLIPNAGHHNNYAIISNVQASGQSITQPVIPRKVLINPNFKGGVEAATSQLMKDTQFMQAISSHAIHLQSDEELLRQQEEFIKKNRMHIEKRRHERSPDRSRSRERSYSPLRRDRRGGSRERRGGSPKGRPRRSSRDPENRFLKRRRSGSFERRREKEKLEEEEDEETRAYRQEIEKQKAMREKILRDKEMRRRKAAEGKQVDEKPSTDEPPSKLKPIIVTESKIISLKKKSNADSTTHSTNNSKTVQQQTTHSIAQSQHKQQTIQRTIPTAKILPEAKRTKIEQQQHSLKDASTTTLNTTAMAVIKPVIKKTISIQADINKKLDNDDDDDDDDVADDDESLDEDLLLADTPSPPLSPPLPKVTSVTKSTKIGKALPTKSSSSSNPNLITNSSSSAFSSSNRRVVLKSSSISSTMTGTTRDQDTDISRKPVFQRLDKRVGVNESAKRKIQRLVIKNAE